VHAPIASSGHASSFGNRLHRDDSGGSVSNNQAIMVPPARTGQEAHPAASQNIARGATSNLFATAAHHALLVFGAIAISILAMMFIKPELAGQLQDLSPFSTVDAASDAEQDQLAAAQAALAAVEHAGQATAPVPVKLTTPEAAAEANLSPINPLNSAASKPASGAEPQQQQWVTQWLSRRYRVAYDATNMLVGAAYSTAGEMKLDPLLILAVMAIESGLNPFAESPVGAQGLMQVMSKVHHEKFRHLGGVKAALNPVANIKVGSRILKDYVTRGGSLEAGLKMYVGAAAFEHDDGYGYKVLAEYRRLKDVATGKKVATITTARTAPKAQPSEAAAKAAPELAEEAEDRVTQELKQSRLEDPQRAAL
jgi:soluble lytic murein transglycosylase-like protein